MKTLRRVKRNEINKENMVALSYCQCQSVLNMFGYDYKVGYNSGVYGWNYDLYCIHGVDIITGYNVPYAQYNNEELKNKLVALENKVRNMEFSDIEKNRNELKQEFLGIFY